MPITVEEKAIIAENLTKVYTLDKERPRTFKEYMGRRLYGNSRGGPKEIKALDDISFQVNKGEAVGIIGPNGSGKSTLLRVLGGITGLSSGKAVIRGKVASVLDLGTGFHPDLSGMENIYLSGEMTGMKRGEIRAKVDEIIAFSELEKFIDTPVKYYSSGMFVRLAFSVIAHLQSDILLLDEVLSVGDAAFQIKSFNKMQELLGSGKTILLVSHNLNSLSRFVSCCLYLEKGKLIGQGNTDEMITAYADNIFFLKASGQRKDSNDLGQMKEWVNKENAPGNEYIRIRKIIVRNETRTADEEIFADEKIVVDVEFDKQVTLTTMSIALRINDYNGNPLFIATPVLTKESTHWLDYLSQPGFKNVKCIIQENIFNSAVFSIDLFVFTDNNIVLLSIPNIISFKVLFKQLNINDTLCKLTNSPISPNISWKICKTN